MALFMALLEILCSTLDNRTFCLGSFCSIQEVCTENAVCLEVMNREIKLVYITAAVTRGCSSSSKT